MKVPLAHPFVRQVVEHFPKSSKNTSETEESSRAWSFSAIAANVQGLRSFSHASANSAGAAEKRKLLGNIAYTRGPQFPVAAVLDGADHKHACFACLRGAVRA